jgi:hypothetical protein
VETTEDIDSSGKFQGAPGPKSPAGIFAFYSPLRILHPGAEIVKLKLGMSSINADSGPDCSRWHSPSV